MRTITAAQDAVLTGKGRAEHVRVEVKDSGGTFRDLSSYPGYDAVDEVSWSENVDDPHATAEVTLKREMEKLSISPFMESSGPNKGFDPAASFAALVDVAREIKISVALVAADTAPASGDWMLVFHGYIDSVDPGGGETRMVLTCRDLGAKLADTFIEKERAYALGSVGLEPVGMRIWEPSTAYALNEYVLPSQARKDAGAVKSFYKCTTAGTSGATEPASWPTSSTVADGTVTWTFQANTSLAGFLVERVMQEILDDNSVAVTLDTPSSPSWSIKQYLQKRESVLDAIRNLARQIGWDVRYKWDSSSSTFKLKFYQPDRTKVATDRTFTKSEYARVDACRLDVAGIRNAVQVVYSDSADLDPAGNPKRKTIVATDATSITRYGRRFMEIAEDDSSQIDTSTEATSMANACRDDLKDPKVDHEVTMTNGFPHAEIGDLYRFTANDRHYSTNQDLALYAVRHVARAGTLETSFSCRGKPSGGYTRWHKIDSRSKPDKSHQLSLLEAAGGVTLSSKTVSGGQQLKVSMTPERLAFGEEFEWHVYDTAGAALSSSTLVTVSRDRELTLADLPSGKTRYWKVVPRTRNLSRIVRAQPSLEQSFTVGSVEPIHANPETVPQAMPPNGSFEGWFEGGSNPDRWTAATGTLGTDILKLESDRKDGKYGVELHSTAVAAKIRSDYFPVKTSATYLLEGWIKKVGTPDNSAQLIVEWYKSDKTAATTASNTITQGLTAIGTGWTRIFDEIAAPSDAVYARIAVAKATAAAYAFYADAIVLRELPTVVAARAHTDAGQTLTEVTFIQIDFEEVDYDSHSAITTGATWKFKVPTGQAGKYSVVVNLAINLGVFAGYVHRDLFVGVNGSLSFPAANLMLEKSDCDDYCSARGSTILDLADGDEISIHLYQSSGANRALYTDDRYNYIAIQRLS